MDQLDRDLIYEIGRCLLWMAHQEAERYDSYAWRIEHKYIAALESTFNEWVAQHPDVELQEYRTEEATP